MNPFAPLPLHKFHHRHIEPIRGGFHGSRKSSWVDIHLIHIIKYPKQQSRYNNGGHTRTNASEHADNPLGPFKKHSLNPVFGSGHETTLFSFREGIAALVIKDGNEHFTIQYAEDGVNFEIASITSLMPTATGPYVPDAFTNTDYGKGITRGIAHVVFANKEPKKNHSILLRFDCDLSLDLHDLQMKTHSNVYTLKPDFYYRYGLSKKQLERIKKGN